MATAVSLSGVPRRVLSQRTPSQPNTAPASPTAQQALREAQVMALRRKRDPGTSTFFQLAPSYSNRAPWSPTAQPQSLPMTARSYMRGTSVTSAFFQSLPSHRAKKPSPTIHPACGDENCMA